MATIDTAGTPTTTLPAGRWTVDTKASELGFRSRGFFGLVPVKGVFHDFTGSLEVHDAGATGALKIAAASLDTKMGKRDDHLRSADFFDVDNSPTVMFALTGVSADADGTLTVAGDLTIRGTTLAVSAPLEASAHGDHLHLSTTLSVDRAAAGVGWSKAGMIKGPAHLHATLVLTRSAG